MGSACLEVLKPAPEDALREWPVTKRVNKSGQGDDNDERKKALRADERQA